jgi:hypothetical protein
MVQQDDNMAPGQQNYPTTSKEENNQNAQSGEELKAGARQDDQLDKLKQNVTEGEEGEKIGSPPNAYTTPKERGAENKE